MPAVTAQIFDCFFGPEHFKFKEEKNLLVLNFNTYMLCFSIFPLTVIKQEGMLKLKVELQLCS